MTTYKRPDLKTLARNGRISNARQKPKTDTLPPHSPEAERAALGCVLLGVAMGSQSEGDELIKQLKPALFYELTNREIFTAMRSLRIENHALDMITLIQWMKDKGTLESVGGSAYVSTLPDATAGVFNFGEYLATLKDKHHRRWLTAKGDELAKLANEPTVTLEDTQARLGELFDATTKASGSRGELKIWRVSDLVAHVPPPNQALVGDNEIRMGPEGLCLVAGPGGTGKSLVLSALGLAGAIGKGHWQGRQVHRKFRTLFLQAENGATRLKKEVETMQKLHPGVDLQSSIFISDPPEGGIPFHRAEFRSSLRREVLKCEPDVLVIDPWSRVAADDSSKDIVDKLAEIYSCLPAGEKCPAVIISAHTKKPRAEDVQRGRGLANMVSGSVALKDSARCVYMILPWSEEPDDERIYWCNAKLNDGAMYPPSVWFRRFGTHFAHDGETDPGEWGKESDPNEERRSVTREMLVTVFKEQKRPGMKRGELVKFLVARFELAESTVWRALKGYGSEWVDCTAGVVALKSKGVEK